MKGREWYREMHEQDHEHGEVIDERGEVEEEIDEDDCPTCKWNEVCKGGCEAYVDCGYKFEKKEEDK